MRESIAGVVARIEWVIDRIGQAASLLALSSLC